MKWNWYASEAITGQTDIPTDILTTLGSVDGAIDALTLDLRYRASRSLWAVLGAGATRMC